MSTQLTNQELFERLRLLVIQHGTQDDVDALHELRERFNRLAAPAVETDEEMAERLGHEASAAEERRREELALLDSLRAKYRQ